MLTSTVLALVSDFSHRRPPPVSDHFVLQLGWSLTRELSVFTSVSVDSSLFSYLFTSANLFILRRGVAKPYPISTDDPLSRSVGGSFVPLQKSRQNHRRCIHVLTEALFGMVLVSV